MGVRYNAEKKKVGNYYSTPIYRFRMKCHLCDNYFEIETDPKNCDYNVVSGARRKNERWEASATETVETTDKEDAKRMAIDAMFKLEHGVEDVQKAKKVAPALHQLQDVQSVWKDDYAANKVLRKKFREEKKVIKDIKTADDELRKKGSLDIPLVPEAEEDVEKAKKTRFYNTGFDAHKKKNRKEISNRSWFGNEAISTVSTKIPGISLRKRSSTSDDPKDDWKKAVIAKCSKTETTCRTNTKRTDKLNLNDEKIQAMEGNSPKDDLDLTDKSVKTKERCNLNDSFTDSDEQLQFKAQINSSTENDNKLNTYPNSDKTQANNPNSLTEVADVSNENEQSSKLSSLEINTNGLTSSSSEDSCNLVKDSIATLKSFSAKRGSSDSSNSQPVSSCSLVSTMYSDSESSDEDP